MRNQFGLSCRNRDGKCHGTERSCGDGADRSSERGADAKGQFLHQKSDDPTAETNTGCPRESWQAGCFVLTLPDPAGETEDWSEDDDNQTHFPHRFVTAFIKKTAGRARCLPGESFRPDADLILVSPVWSRGIPLPIEPAL